MLKYTHGDDSLKNTKIKISKKASELFNEKGYNNVTLREIAAAAGTTIGNLTYYFPQKDDLLASLQEQAENQFLSEVDFTAEPTAVLTLLLQSFFEAEQNEIDNPYYYENISEFYQDSKKARDNIERFRARLLLQYNQIFDFLKNNDILNSEYSTDAYQNLAYLCVFLPTFWVSKAAPFHATDFPKIPITKSVYELLKPYVTKDYRHIYTEIYMRLSQVKPN